MLIFALISISYFFLTQKKTREKSQQKLAMIYDELEIEKTLSKNYNNNNSIIQSLEDKTASKFLNIKVDLINIDFTYKEICNFI